MTPRPDKTFTADFGHMSPAQAFCFIDEHPDSVNWGELAVAMVDQSTLGEVYIIDVPVSFHNRASAVSFADGPTEIHPWKDSRACVPVKCSAPAINVISTPNNPDSLWLA
jgi:hypothetical protein